MEERKLKQQDQMESLVRHFYGECKMKCVSYR